MAQDIKIEVTDRDLDNILITAVEGGINYWACVRAYRNAEGAPCSVEIQEEIDQGSATFPGWHKVTRAKVKRGLQVMAAKYPHQLAAFVASGKPGDYAPDAEVCDVIIQCALFFEVIYG